MIGPDDEDRMVGFVVNNKSSKVDSDRKLGRRSFETKPAILFWSLRLACEAGPAEEQ